MDETLVIISKTHQINTTKEGHNDVSYHNLIRSLTNSF